MKKTLGNLILAAVVLVGMSTVASAAPTTCSNQAIVVGATCTLDGLTFLFSNVSFSPNSAGDALTLDSGITTISGNDAVLGFQINAGAAGLPVDVVIDYTVTASSAVMSGIDASYIGPNGTISETAYNTSTGGIISQLFDPQNNNGVVVTGTPTTFGPFAGITIHKDVEAITFSEFTDSIQVSGVPEPATLSMMGLGLLGLGLIGRRKRKV